MALSSVDSSSINRAAIMGSPVPSRAIGDYVKGCLAAYAEAAGDSGRAAVITLLAEQAQSQAAGSGDAMVSVLFSL